MPRGRIGTRRRGRTLERETSRQYGALRAPRRSPATGATIKPLGIIVSTLLLLAFQMPLMKCFWKSGWMSTFLGFFGGGC